MDFNPLRRIDGGEALEAYPASSKASDEGMVIDKLRDLGRLCALQWLAKHFADVVERSTVNIANDYLDDMRMGSAGD